MTAIRLLVLCVSALAAGSGAAQESGRQAMLPGNAGGLSTVITNVVNNSVRGNGRDQFEYIGKWTYSGYPAQAGCYGGDCSFSAATNAFVQLKFFGSRLRLYGKRAAQLGAGTVSIDDGAVGQADFRAPTNQNLVLVYESPELTDFTHTLLLRANAGICALDYAEIETARGTPDKLQITGSDSLFIPPEGSTRAWYGARVLNLSGVVMADEPVTWSLAAQVKGVSLDTNLGYVTVHNLADAGSAVTLMASAGGALATKKVMLPAVRAVDVFAQVDLRTVKVGGEIGRRMELSLTNNLLMPDIDRTFLVPFSARKAVGNEDFIGLGRTLEGIIRVAANTDNDALTARKKHIVSSLCKFQLQDGYIGIMLPEARTWGLWDVREQGDMLAALVADFQLFGNREALGAAQKLADFIISRYAGKPADKVREWPCQEYIGMAGLNNGLLALYAATQDRRYLAFSTNQLGTASWNPKIVIGRTSKADGHTVAYMSQCLAQLELHRLQPDPALLTPTRRAVSFMMRKDGMAITGGVGQDQCWANDQYGRDLLGETCSTVHQILLFDSLMRMEGDLALGDYMERQVYNALLGAQAPDGRRIRFVTPFSGKREYAADTECCPGSFRRMLGYLPQLIYYRADTGVAVNLYTTSETTLEGVGGTTVKISQETDFPSTGRVTLQIDPQKPTRFPVHLRMPRWCQKAEVAINDTPKQSLSKPGEILRIDWKWQKGDRITLDMAMPWRFVAGRLVQANRAAVMRGPLVYALAPSRAGTEAKDLKRLVVLPETAELVPDETVRPGGTACRIKADLDKADKGALTLTLTEFPDPDGQWIYFQIPDAGAMAGDELFTSGAPQGTGQVPTVK
ncbi:MAG: beta-L-arabinofuranosidase domain-containing protein [Kiritimatiellia bacterium]